MPVSVPTVHVTGEAEREVVPDEVVVAVSIRTPRQAAPADALRLGVERRGRVRAALADGAPGAVVSDARVTTLTEWDQVEETDVRGVRTTRSVVAGYSGSCELRVRAEASAAVALMAIVGTHPDVGQARPGFQVGRALTATVVRELEQEAVRDALVRAEGLARAAGLRAGEVLVIGAPPAADPQWGGGEMAVYSMKSADAGAMEQELGELVPEPEILTARMAVTVSLLPAA